MPQVWAKHSSHCHDDKLVSIASINVVTLLLLLLLHDLLPAKACCMPVIFVTVEEALGDLAQLKSGERVLIHAAAGGVGLVAIQYAQFVGAEATFLWCPLSFCPRFHTHPPCVIKGFCA